MLKQAYEAGVKQAMIDAISSGTVGAPAAKLTPPVPSLTPSPLSPTRLAGNSVNPASLKPSESPATPSAASTGMGGNQLGAESGKQTTASVWRKKISALTGTEQEYKLPLGVPTAALGALGGGAGGGILGGLGGMGLANAMGWDEKKSTGVGGILGALAGAGLGGYGGYQVGNDFATNAARRAIVGDSMHSMGIPPGGYDMEGPQAQELRDILIEQGVLSQKEASFHFNTDRWPQELAGTAADMAIPAALGSGIGALGGHLSDDSDAGKGAIRGLLAGAGAGLGMNVGHRATADPSFWKWFTTGNPYDMNVPAVAGSAAGGGGLGYLLGRKLTQDD